MEFKSSKDYVHSIIKNPGILLRRPSFWPAPLRASALASLAPFYQSQSVHVAISTILCLLFLCTLVYIVSWLRFSIHRSSRQPGRVPPTIPYMIPFAGSAFSFVLNPSKCVEAATRVAGPKGAYGLKVLHHTLYFLNGPKNVEQIWKYKTKITTPNVPSFFVYNVFGMSKKAVNMYTRDDSGILSKPEASSNVAPHNRIDYLTHASFHKHFNGQMLPTLTDRWSTIFTRRFKQLNIGEEWVEASDMVDFWMPTLIASLNETIAGPVLERVNPDFTRDFLEFFGFVPRLMKGLPIWLIPKAFSVRNTLHRNVKEWHAIAGARFTESDIDADGDGDPWWGSALIRDRQKILRALDDWDDDARACSDLGLLWGVNNNVNYAGIWTIIEVFKDKTVLSRVRAELEAAEFTGTISYQVVDRLLSLPLLHSVYAEVLRLRVEVQTVLQNDRDDIRINEWRFPMNSILFVPARPAHKDPDFWNTRDGEHPLDKFWADRFIAYSNDPRSGPRRRTNLARSANKQAQMSKVTGPGEAKYVSSGLANSFMPYGVGERVCPGRFYAKRQILAFCAKIVHELDIELLATEKEFESSSVFYGLGIQPPLRSIPFKMRRRKVDS